MEAFGDDANISLTVRGKGTGAVSVGNSSQPVLIGGSTSGIALTQRYLVQYTIPALSSGPYSVESTVAVPGLTTNSVLVLQNRLINNSTGGVTIHPRCSTADELTLMFANQSDSTLSGSTASGYLLQFGF